MDPAGPAGTGLASCNSLAAGLVGRAVAVGRAQGRRRSALEEGTRGERLGERPDEGLV